MLTEMVKFGHKTKEEIKAIQSEGKESIQGTNSEERNTETQQSGTKGKINIQSEQNEGTRIQKNEERLRNLWDNFKHSNIQIRGMS